MVHIQVIFLLLFAAVLLVGVAQKFRVPYPLALVVGGIALGFTPGLEDVYVSPSLVLPIVLPPILYYAAFGIAFRDFKRNWKEIFSLALGLVVFTTVVIGVIFKWMFPQYSWALAFAFGAIVSPPDAIAVTAILKRFPMNARLLSLLEGESLVNDASAIVLYKLAVTALLSGSFSLADGSIEFAKDVFGGVGLGLVLGFILQRFSRRYLEPILGVVFSFTIPYVTFILANALNVSGVLAVVVNGVIGARLLFSHHSSLRRVVGYAVWDTFIILMNCFVFILIGLQLRTLTGMMTASQVYLYTLYAVVIALAMVTVRMIWVYGLALGSYLTQKEGHKTPHPLFREAAIIGWAGMRGIVSLAVALGLPYALPNGMPIEGRNQVVFMTFVVIVFTLIIPGFSLPALIRFLKLPSFAPRYDERKIRNELIRAAEEKLQHLLSSLRIDQTEFEFLKVYFASQHRVLEISHSAETKLHNFEHARQIVIQTQRKKLLELWELKQLDDQLLSHLENELDIVEVHTARAELQ